MSTIEYIEGKLPKGYKADYDISLFNSEPYRLLQRRDGWIEFHLIRKDKRKILGSIFFLMEGKVAHSPWKAPFGSFELADEVTTHQLFEFIAFVEAGLLKCGAKKIVIKNYPETYHLFHHNILSVVLFNHKYKITDSELGACLQIDHTPLEVKLDKWEKRKLIQGSNANLEFKHLTKSRLKEVYDFISYCRQQKGYPLSMSWREINKTYEKLKDGFELFGVFLNSSLVAASLSIRVNKNVLYNFYSAHDEEHDKLSPVVFLLHGMYNWSSGHRIQILDLGTSALGGKPNFNLIDFKLRMGATPAMKLTFEKSWK